MSHGSVFIPKTLTLSILAASFALSGCVDQDNNGQNNDVAETQTPFALQILHASDMEAGVEALEDAPRFSAVLNALRDDYPDQTLVVASGDTYIPGPFFSASGDNGMRALLGDNDNGRADILMLNAMGFQASAFGNHEFDAGPAQTREILRHEDKSNRKYTGPAFPYLSANMDFSQSSELSDFVVADGQEAATIPNSIARSTVVTVKGEKIGIVGASTPLLPNITTLGDSISVSPTNPDNLAALAAVIQQSVDALSQSGIDKILLLTHMQQIAIEKSLSGLLKNVDVIVAGGSNTILADSSDRLRDGDTAADDYPLLSESASGEPVAIVNTDGNYRYVGRLVVDFDEQGLLITDSIDEQVSGAYAADAQGVTDLGGPEANATVVNLSYAIGEIIKAKDGNTFGRTQVYLNGDRASVRTEETNFGNLTADANLAAARDFDSSVRVSIKNGGGIRASIGEVDPMTTEKVPPAANAVAGKEAGEISQLDIENTLKFNNTLSLMTLTATELRQVIEHGVSASEEGATPGQFPQVAGLRFSFDPSLPANGRVLNLVIVDDNGLVVDTLVANGSLQGDPNREIRIVTLNFLADGGDGYPYPDFVAADALRVNRIELTAQNLDEGQTRFAAAGSEQDALAEYLAAGFTLQGYDREDLPASADQRIQNLAKKATDTVVQGGKPAIGLSVLGSYASGIFDGSASEIGAFDPASQRFFVTNSASNTLDVLDASDPATPSLAQQIDLSSYGGRPNSVAIMNGVVAVSVAAINKTDPGSVLFFDTTGSLLKSVTVGALPDMITFTPDGGKLVVANEAEPSDDYSIDPEGSVSIIDISAGVANAAVSTADFSAFNGQEADLKAAGVRIFGPGASVAQDLEPEYVTISADSGTAWVALQEANAFAIVDLDSANVTDVVSLGAKDHSLTKNALDASNRDDAINIQAWPVMGLYQPDAIAAYSVDGKSYIVTANEGDSRDYTGFSEEARVKDVILDPTAFPDAASLQDDANLGRLKISTVVGDSDGDGDYDLLYAYGARSFAIWDATGNLVFDSGSRLERIIASQLPDDFNSTNDANSSFDSRSDDKGPEPEGVELGEIDGRVYAFIGLERVGGVMVFDVSNPQTPAFVQYLNNRDFSGVAAAGTAGDLGPEGLRFIAAADSPTDEPILVVTNEVSGSTTFYEITTNH